MSARERRGWLRTWLHLAPLAAIHHHPVECGGRRWTLLVHLQRQNERLTDYQADGGCRDDLWRLFLATRIPHSAFRILQQAVSNWNADGRSGMAPSCFHLQLAAAHQTQISVECRLWFWRVVSLSLTFGPRWLTRPLLTSDNRLR